MCTKINKWRITDNTKKADIPTMCIKINKLNVELPTILRKTNAEAPTVLSIQMQKHQECVLR